MFRLLLYRASTNFINARKPICTSQTHLNVTTSQDDTFKQIYKFSLIRAFGVFNRLKVYQTLTTAVTIPGSIILNQIGVLCTNDVIGTCVVGVSGCLMFYSIGYFTKNVVGILSVNEEESEIKVAYVDFWGKRVDKLIPVSDVMAQSDLRESVTDPVYVRLRRLSNAETLKIISFKSTIVDEKCFDRVILGIENI